MRGPKSSRRQKPRVIKSLHIQYPALFGAAWTALAHRRTIASMGSRNPGRDVRWATREDTLGRYARDYKLTAQCRRSWCEHQRELHIQLLLRIFPAETTLGHIADRLRCHRCGLRGARIVAQYTGSTGSGR
jgi:hypothetical protein